MAQVLLFGDAEQRRLALFGAAPPAAVAGRLPAPPITSVATQTLAARALIAASGGIALDARSRVRD